MTKATLCKQFKAASRKASGAIRQYKNLLFKLYMPYYDGARQSDASGRDGTIADVYLSCLNSDGSIREYATNLSWTFYRRGRGGKFYEKPQDDDKRHCDVCNGPCYPACPYRHSEEKVSQDYLDLCKLETAIDTAVYERERLRDELEAVGVDTWRVAFD